MIFPRRFTALIWCVLMVSTVTMVPCAATQTRADSPCSGLPCTDTTDLTEIPRSLPEGYVWRVESVDFEYKHKPTTDDSFLIRGVEAPAPAVVAIGVFLTGVAIVKIADLAQTYIEEMGRARANQDIAYNIYSEFFIHNIKEIDLLHSKIVVKCSATSYIKYHRDLCSNANGQISEKAVRQVLGGINVLDNFKLGDARNAFSWASDGTITTQKTALTTIQTLHDEGHRSKKCMDPYVPKYCSKTECNLAKSRIQRDIVTEERRYSEYLTDSYNKAKVDALYAVSKDTDRTIFEELERLNEKVPRDPLHDEL